MKVSVAQLAPGSNRTQNIQRTVDVIREAARQDADLIVLPEMCTSPYMLKDTVLDDWAEEIPGGIALQYWLREVRRLKLYLVAGVMERAGDKYFNSAVVLGPQGLMAHYRKAHLFGWERHCLMAGNNGLSTLEIHGTKAGVLVCYDLRFVEVVRLLALAGVQLLCVPTTWTNVGKPQPLDKNGWCAAAHLVVGHAYANNMFVLCAGRVGQEGTVRYLGNSLIAGPSGQILTGPADSETETILVAEIEPSQANNKGIGQDNDVFGDRRTDLYTLKDNSEL